jgi:hypothetical protein
VGDFFKSQKNPEVSAQSSKYESETKKSDKKDKKSSEKGDYSSGGDIEILKFKRQFVVPVLEGGQVDALVILNLNVELNSDAPSSAFTYEPKFRDAFTRELLKMSRQGLFGQELTSPDTYEIIRETLLVASKQVMKDGVENVLILDLSRQDQ